MTKVVVVNGRPRAGKDSFIAACEQHLGREGVSFASFSSIDPIRDILSAAGVDVSEKTEADRKLLAVMGDALEEHSSYRTHRCIAEIMEFHHANGPESVFFLHIREPYNIRKVMRGIAQTRMGQNIEFTTILIKSKRELAINSNRADANVGEMAYDEVIHNDGTLGDLHILAGQCVKNLLRRSA